MIDPPDNNPGHAEGDGPLTTTPSPLPQTNPYQEAGAAVTTVTPPPSPQAPDPSPSGDSPAPNGWIEFAKWLLGDHGRTAWAMAFVIVVLAAFIVVTALLAPQLGALGALGGLGASAGSGVLVELARRRKRGDGPDEE